VREWSLLGQTEVGAAYVDAHRILGCIGIATFNCVDNRNMFVERHQRPAGLHARTVSIEPELIVEIVKQQIFQP
jgi:hypothetical protein